LARRTLASLERQPEQLSTHYPAWGPRRAHTATHAWNHSARHASSDSLGYTCCIASTSSADTCMGTALALGKSACATAPIPDGSDSRGCPSCLSLCRCGHTWKHGQVYTDLAIFPRVAFSSTHPLQLYEPRVGVLRQARHELVQRRQHSQCLCRCVSWQHPPESQCLCRCVSWQHPPEVQFLLGCVSWQHPPESQYLCRCVSWQHLSRNACVGVSPGNAPQWQRSNILCSSIRQCKGVGVHCT